jgi:hypothetical protein
MYKEHLDIILLTIDTILGHTLTVHHIIIDATTLDTGGVIRAPGALERRLL